MKCFCGKKLTGKQEKYCSQSCSRYWSTRIRRQEKIKNNVLTCLNCGKKQKGVKFKRLYCSEECRNSYKGKQYYEENLVSERKRKLSNYYKRYFSNNHLKVYKKYSNKCDNCNEKDKSKLTIHHVDLSGTSNNPNNELDNLVLLCNRCHGKIHRYLQIDRTDEDIVRTYVRTWEVGSKSLR